ncbi:hypothetical protein U91I_00806 [alpha proteobacterium U9-1i]|nr:hypothetical protein U91I_00806 [alpha proteobacterium U9-1i]
MTRDDIASDLAYVRAVAEEGRHAPLLGGSHFLFWGVLNALTYLLHWSVLEGHISLGGGVAFAFLWTGYGVIAAIGMITLRGRNADKPGTAAIGVRAERAIWAGVSIAIVIIALGCITRMALESDPLAPNNIMAPVLALFGAALSATAMMARERWLNLFALIAYAAALFVGAFANASWAYPVAAAANFIVLAIPGFILLRREPAAIV